MADTVIQRAFVELDARTQGFEQRITGAKKTLADFTDFVKNKPGLAAASAAAALTAAFVAVAAQAARMADEVDVSFRKIKASLNVDPAQIDRLRDGIIALGQETPRSIAELTKLAVAIRESGETDPQQILRTARALALVGDAVGSTDLDRLASFLDDIRDQFSLTADGAREALLRIVALSQGRFPLEKMADTFKKVGAQMGALGVEATKAAEGVAAVLDLGVDSEKITEGLTGLLDKTARAQAEAVKATGNEKKALEALASTFNQTTLQQDGLLVSLANLYKGLGQTQQGFTDAGLSVSQFTLAQKAYVAVSQGVQEQTLSTAESIEKLKTAAEVNRGSASALAGILKNELSAVLIELGNKVLPPVIDLLTGLSIIFSTTKREAVFAAKQTREAAVEFQKLADMQAKSGQKLQYAPKVAIETVDETVSTIAKNPAILQAYNERTLQQLRKNILAAVEALEGKGLTNERWLQSAQVIALIRQRLEELNPVAEGAVKTVSDAGTQSGIAADELAKQAAELAKQVEQAEERFRSAADNVREYAASLGATDNPMAAFEQKQAALRQELNKAIDLLPKAKQAAARSEARLFLEQLADAGDRLRSSQAVELSERLMKILGAQSTSAIDALRREYADLTKQLEDVAKAADALGTAEGAATARRAREGVRTLTDQRDALIELQKVADEFARAQKTIATFEAQTNANFTDTGVTLADYKKALSDIQSEETRLKEIRDRAAEGTVVRQRAEEELKKVQQARLELEKNGGSPAKEIRSAAELTVTLGAGLRAAAQAGLGLVQALGEGNGELAQMLAGVASIAGGIESIGNAAKKAGGFGELFTSAEGITSVIGGLTQTVGGIVAVTQSLTGNDQQAKEQRKVMEANTAAIMTLAKNLNDFGGAFTGSDLKAVFEGVERLFNEGRTPSNFLNLGIGKIGQKYNNYALNDPELPDYKRIDPTKFFASVGTSMEKVEAVAKQLGVTLDGTVGSYRKLAEALAKADFAALSNTFEGVTKSLRIWSQISGTASDPLDQIANKFRSLVSVAPELAKLFDVNDVFTPEGRARLKEKVRELLRSVLLMDPNSAEAKDFMLNKLGGLKLDDFFELFSGALEGLDNFKDGLSEFVGQLDAFQQAARIFGLQGADYVNGLIAALATQFPALQGLMDGIDLNNADSVALLKSRLRDLFLTLNEGGLTVGEGQIADAIAQIIAALGELPEVLSPLQQALDALDARKDIFGMSNVEEFTARGNLLKGKFPSLAEILGPNFATEINSDAGRSKLKDSISAAINGILEDDVITAEEAPLLAALKQLLTLVTGAIDDAAADAAEAAAAAEAARRERNATAAEDATMEIQLGDQTGAEAFFTKFNSFTQKFRDALGTFDVTTQEGIAAATVKLQDFYASIEGLSDEELVERFGMTRDEIIAAISDIDGGLDGLGDALKELATAQTDFLNQINLAYFDAFDQGLDAVLLQTEIWVEQMIATARALGLLTPEMEEKIRAIGDRRVSNYMAQQAQAAQQQQTREPAAVSDRVDTGRVLDGETTAQRVSSISETSATQLIGTLTSSLVEQRATRVAAEQIASVLSSLIGGGGLMVPALPPGANGLSGTPTIQLIINVQGPIMGQTATEAGQQLAAATLPMLNEALARAAGLEARLSGVPLS